MFSFLSSFPTLKTILLVLLFLMLFSVIIIQFNIIENIERYLYGVNDEVYLENYNVSRMFEYEVRELVEEISEHRDQPYQNASFDEETGEIIEEEIGHKVLVNETVNQVIEAEPNTQVEIKSMPLYPELSKNLLESISTMEASFSTWIGPGNSGRVTNIKRATGDVNKTILFPGQIFSFNQETLPRTWETGYRFAPIIVGDTVVQGIGGGICQVSSTLYNVVLRADLEVLERHPHGEPVDYVPPGRDATVAGDYLDLKFRNNTNKFLLIEGIVLNGQVNLRLYSND